MIDSLVHNILQQLQQPKQDIEKNVRALLTETISKMDLVSQQELLRHQQALNLANQRLNVLQKQVDELQQQLDKQQNSSNPPSV